MSACVGTEKEKSLTIKQCTMSKHLFGKCTFVQLCFLAAMALSVLPAGTVDAASASVSQTSTVSGVVTSAADGMPLIGVSVQIKGTTNGAITDLDGNYTVSVKSGQTLVFSYIGFVTQEIAFTGQKTLNVVLQEEVVSKSEMRFVKGGETQTLSVLSPVQPEVASGADWCSVSYVSVTQRGTYTYNVEVGANTETDDRSTTISVTAGGFSATVQVTQTAADGLVVGSPSYSMSAAGGPLHITLTSNGDYSYTVNDAWITEAVLTEGSRAMTESSVNFTVSANRTDSERTGTITFTLGDAEQTVSVVQEPGQAATVSGETAAEIVQSLGLGWNLGNQLDSHNEGQPADSPWSGTATVSQALFYRVADAGFTSVRIPVTWLGHIGEAPDYTIDEDYMNRVAQMVDYAEAAGLNAIVNIHHDGANSEYWLDIKDAATDEDVNKAVKAQLKAMWTQIAERFKDKGNFLVFESMNEIHDGGWGWGDNRTDGGKQYGVLNEWNQVFVDAVRATGGNNTNRYLGVPGYTANIDLTVADDFELPDDVDDNQNRLIVAVHFYDPIDYTENADNIYSEWGHTADPSKAYSGMAEDNVKEQFGKMKTKFIDKDIPVYIGEMGCVHRADPWSELFRLYYLEYVCKAAKENGLAPFYWDAGGDGSGTQSWALFNRTTGGYINNAEEVIDVMKRGVFDESEDYTLQWVYDNCAPTAQ